MTEYENCACAHADIASYIAYYNTERRQITSAQPNSRPYKPYQIKRIDCPKNPKHLR
jgi:hypothetical protein